jgi:tRNA pseudouridine55 synthase
MESVISLDKPSGMSSAAVVGRVKRLLPRGIKIGHAGTLDSFATGVLLLLVGKATRSCESLMNQPKQYEATLKLGATTPTNDPDFPETQTPDAPRPDIEAIRAAAAKFVGTIQQSPPTFCALKIAGKRASDLARQGRKIELKPRAVRIDAIEILSWQWPLLRLRIDCGRGTYIRALARDLGEALKTGAYVTELRRTRIGEFAVEQSVTLEQLQRDGIQGSMNGTG